MFFFCTHRVDVESNCAALHGIYGGLTASQRSFQGVVGGIDCCFARWVLEREVGIRKPICLRKKLKVASLDQDQKTFPLLTYFQKKIKELRG